MKIVKDLLYEYNRNVLGRLDSPAITIDDVTINYGEFNYLVNSFSKNFKNNERVIVALEKSFEFYVSIFSILAAGACYIPVDLSQKNLNLDPIIRNNSVRKIVSNNLSHEVSNSVDLIIPNFELDGFISNQINIDDNEDIYKNLAYVIYTSGSTGYPKGVKISRNNLSFFVESLLDYELFRPGLKWTQFARHTFDLSVFEIFVCLLSGGHLYPMAQIAMPARFMIKNGIEVWTTTPSGINLVYMDRINVGDKIGSLKYVLTCGEPLTEIHLTKLREINKTTKLLNTYGPTEATVFCTLSIHDLQMHGNDGFKDGYLGVPISGTSLFLRNKDDKGIGELVIEGPQVASGYIEEQVTSQKFIEVSKLVNQYFTGDLVLEDKNHFFFKGRVDRQIKHKGYRIELDGIEARLSEVLKISIVALYDYDHFVYIISSSESPEFFSEKILNFTENFERPFCIHTINEFVLTNNGKINKSAYNGICERDNCTKY